MVACKQLSTRVLALFSRKSVFMKSRHTTFSVLPVLVCGRIRTGTWPQLCLSIIRDTSQLTKLNKTTWYTLECNWRQTDTTRTDAVNESTRLHQQSTKHHHAHDCNPPQTDTMQHTLALAPICNACGPLETCDNEQWSIEQERQRRKTTTTTTTTTL